MFKRLGLFRQGQATVLSGIDSKGSDCSIHVPQAHDKVVLIHAWQRDAHCREMQQHVIALEWVPCHLGGRRPWFRCPVAACRRRVACIYYSPTGQWTCRCCQALVYETQYERTSFRLMSKGDKIRNRLGWGPGILRPPGDKPKYMHWRTFERLRLREQHIVQALASMILPQP